MPLNARIYVAGHQGLVGSALMRTLQARGYTNLITKSLSECDLRDQQAVQRLFNSEGPEYVFLAAARVGGILANSTRPAEFIYDNLAIELNVIHAAHIYNVKKLLFLGSSCIYPRDAQQPIVESALLTGPLEKTNEPYAIAKIAGISLCQSYNRQYGTNFICAMPTNLYGPHDNFSVTDGHVIPALIAKFCDAVQHNKNIVEVGGTGTAYREFLYVDDCAEALVFLMNNFDTESAAVRTHSTEFILSKAEGLRASGPTPARGEWSVSGIESIRAGKDWINVGTGQDRQIRELVYTIARLCDFKGDIVWNSAFPDGTPRKRLDVTRINNLGWHARTQFEDGLMKTIEWYKSTPPLRINSVEWVRAEIREREL